MSEKNQEITVVALDAMGGDNAPGEIVKGAVAALQAEEKLEIRLVGRKEDVEKALEGLTYPADRLTIVDAREVIEVEEHPAGAIKSKKDSSIVVGLKLVKEGEADAFVSSGSTGAVLVGGQLIVKTIKGIRRAPLAPFIPTSKGPCLLIDCGANVDAKPEDLVLFAKLGYIYCKHAMHIENPKVGLLNIGTEETKGNALTQAAFPLLKDCKEINFVGNVEAREIPAGAVDVAVCEAFVGNVLLKTYEGVGKTLLSEIKGALLSNFQAKIGGLLIKKTLKKSMKRFDASEYGGAMLLGLNGLVVKAHGNATSKEIKNAILQCVEFKTQHVPEEFKKIFGLEG
ncbi:MAG: phosphate acyltransferase PlsX [Lachnospiraceae bacterium]|nr:phosphate acyltransferase PlsX [Lachnospiraceae bacterium]